MDSSFDPDSMLSLPDRTLLVKLFYTNGESTTIALRKFRTEEGLKAQKSPISSNGILNLARRFQETGSLEDRPRSGRPSLRADRVHVVQSVTEESAAETSTGSSSAREAEENSADSGIVDSTYSARNLVSVSVQDTGTSPIITDRF
ncbi:hypothetical protein AVEN_275039-1 [Araneus ventricosus]|uniref:Uncharacterized protein n=1 Tax=Araneus ventricosus TaxID=182803 RepID=A0A4Y2ESN8_ARAVE|nr:hypothetical protein AVEN_275039-1 [Araneus ventricosus]